MYMQLAHVLGIILARWFAVVPREEKWKERGGCREIEIKPFPTSLLSPPTPPTIHSNFKSNMASGINDRNLVTLTCLNDMTALQTISQRNISSLTPDIQYDYNITITLSFFFLLRDAECKSLQQIYYSGDTKTQVIVD